ncbi:hypothetical protein Tco_1226779 [Tanacetum coccineum]
MAKNLKKPSQAPRGVSVGPKVGFKPAKEYRPVAKKPTANTSSIKKKGVEPTKENVETSNISTTPIVEKIRKLEQLVIDGKGTLVDDDGKPMKRVDYSGDHDSDDEVCSLDNDMAHFMATEMVGFGTQSLLKKCKDSYVNGDYDEDPYDDDMYEGHDLPDKLQDICDSLDIRVEEYRGQMMRILTLWDQVVMKMKLADIQGLLKGVKKKTKMLNLLLLCYFVVASFLNSAFLFPLKVEGCSVQDVADSTDTIEGRMKDTESSTFHVLANALIVRSCQTLLCGLLRISPSNGVVPQSPVHTTSLDNLKHQLTTCSNRLKLRTVTRRHARSISSTADSLGASSTFRSNKRYYAETSWGVDSAVVVERVHLSYLFGSKDPKPATGNTETAVVMPAGILGSSIAKFLYTREVDNNGSWLGIQRRLLQLERQQAHIMNMLQSVGVHIDDLEYTLKPEFEGYFKVTNMNKKGHSERGKGGDRNQTTRSLAVKKMDHGNQILRLTVFCCGGSNTEKD